MALSEQKKQSWNWKWTLAAVIVLAGATAISYYPSLSYNFQFDDIFNIQKFFHLRINDLKAWAFGGGRWISYVLNAVHYKMGKHNPFVYRRSNMMFHIITGLLIFFVTYLSLLGLKKYGSIVKKAFPIAFFTALLFLLHPVQTQTVSYVIQGQLEGLASLFMMAIILVYLFYHHALSWKTKAPLLLVLAILGIFSCGTKEIAILSPLMLLLFDWFFVSQGNITELKKKWLFFSSYTALITFQYLYYLNFPFLKSSFLGTAVLPNNVGNVITANATQTINPLSYFMSQFKVVVHYIFMFLWPFSISVDYDWKMPANFFSTEVLLPLLFLLFLFVGTLFLLRKDKTHLIAFCSLWFFIGLAPRSTIIPSTELVADYKTYFSSFGIFLLLALALVFSFEWITKKLSFKNNQLAACGITTLCVILLGLGTYERNRIWRSGEAFWMSNIQNSPKKARAYNNYAVAIAEQERYTEAIPYLRKAIKLDPHYPDAWSNISVCYCRIGKLDIAIESLRRALTINPNYPEFYNNLSSYLLTKKEYAEVKKLTQHAIKLRPYYGKAYFNWGQALYEEGDKLGAFERIKFACINADYQAVESFRSYAELSVELQKYEDALVGFTHLAELLPQDADVFFNIGNAHYCLDHLNEAQQVYESLLAKNPQEYRSWLNLAEVYVKKNDLPAALACYEKAQPMASYHPVVITRLAECKEYIARGSNVA
jgi:tetratricopeptide (TPR) repeat protein